MIALGDVSAQLEYTLLPEQTIDFTHTYVPVEFQGKGYAEALVQHGLAWAKEQGFKAQASCWYVRKYL